MVFKRKRVYAPRTHGGKRRKFSYRRRRGRSSIASGFASKSTGAGFIKFRGLSAKKKKSYHRRLIRNTDVLPKWRSAASGSYATATTTDLGTAGQTSVQVLKATGVDLTDPTNFTNRRGGVATITTASNGPVLRGGVSEITLAHESAETIWYNVYLCYTKSGLPADGSVNKSSDPWTQSNAVNTSIRGIRKYEGFLETNTAKTFRFKIPAMNIDYQDFQAHMNVYFWCIQVGNTVTSSSVACTVTSQEVAWFAGVDVVS